MSVHKLSPLTPSRTLPPDPTSIHLSASFPSHRLIIGRKLDASSATFSQASSCTEPQDGWVIVSKPAQHSRKPYVGHLLGRHVSIDEHRRGRSRRGDAVIVCEDDPQASGEAWRAAGGRGGGREGEEEEEEEEEEKEEEKVASAFDGVEIFARELRCRWMSLGDQVHIHIPEGEGGRERDRASIHSMRVWGGGRRERHDLEREPGPDARSSKRP
jgi:hypothetical protein